MKQTTMRALNNLTTTSDKTAEAETLEKCNACPELSNHGIDVTTQVYSPKQEVKRVFDFLCQLKKGLNLPENLDDLAKNVEFTSEKDTIYFPIPFKETETTAALKGIEALLAAALANLKYGESPRKIEINLEQTTCFLFQTYLSTIDGIGKYDPAVKAKLKGTTPLHLRICCQW
jgi:hypothetical protein